MPLLIDNMRFWNLPKGSGQDPITGNELKEALNVENNERLVHAWMSFDGRLASPPQIIESFNGVSVVRQAAGQYLLTFSVEFVTINHIMLGLPDNDPATGVRDSVFDITQTVTGGGQTTIRIATLNAAQTGVDTPYQPVVLMGELI